MRCWWALALGMFLFSLPGLAQTRTLEELEEQLQGLEITRSVTERQLREKRRIIASNEDLADAKRSEIRQAGDGLAGHILKKTNQRLIELAELANTELAEDVQLLEERLDTLDDQLEDQRQKIADFRERQRQQEEQAALEARMAAEKAARLEAERIAEERRIAAERVAEERRIAREEARQKRQWTLIALVGGMLVALFGLFFALRAFGANVALSEWSRSFYWLVKASIAVTFALFFLTSIETVFGALTIPDWMRRPLADLLDKASDAIDPEVQGASQ